MKIRINAYLLYTLIIIALLFIPPRFLGAQNSLSFSDIPETHPYSAAISHFKQAGILLGKSTGKIEPEHEISRVEALKLIITTSKIAVPESISEDIYPDVLASDWFAPYVAYAKEKAITKVKGEGYFLPQDIITRADALEMLLRINNAKLTEPTVAPYSDVPIKQTISKYFEYAKQYNLFPEKINVQVDANKPLNRGELIQLLYLYQQSKDENSTLSDTSGGIVAVSQALPDYHQITDQNNIPFAKIDYKGEQIYHVDLGLVDEGDRFYIRYFGVADTEDSHTQSWVVANTVNFTNLATGLSPGSMYVTQSGPYGPGFYSIRKGGSRTIELIMSSNFESMTENQRKNLAPHGYPIGKQEILMDYTFTTQYISGGKPHQLKKHKVLITYEFTEATNKVQYIDDSNVGKIWDQFYNGHHFQRGRRVRNGHRFVFKAGTTHLNGNVDRWPKMIRMLGTKEHPIIFEGEVGENGELLSTLDGKDYNLKGNGSAARDLLDIEESEYVIIRNLILKNAENPGHNASGIRLIRGGNIIIENCIFENDNNGIFTAETTGPVTIKGNVFKNSGHFPGGHAMYLEGEQAYVVNNHIYNSQYHSFRSRLGYTYLANNFIENAANTEVSIFGNPEANQDNSHIVMIGNIITKKPHQRSDGQPGNKQQFIQIGGRGKSNANVYLYHNSFILDQGAASDDGADHKNTARLIMFSDTETNDNLTLIAQNNLIWGSTALARESEAGKGGIFKNNAYVRGSVIPSQWTTVDNTAINPSTPPFKKYVLNSGGLKNNVDDLSPISSLDNVSLAPQSSLTFLDRQGQSHPLDNGLFNAEDPFNFSFTGKFKQIAANKTSAELRGAATKVGALEASGFVAAIPSCSAEQELINGFCSVKCSPNESRNNAGNCVYTNEKVESCETNLELFNGTCYTACVEGEVRDLLGQCVVNKACPTDKELFLGVCVSVCPTDKIRGDNLAAACLAPADSKPDFHKITDKSNLPFPTTTYKGEKVTLIDVGIVDEGDQLEFRYFGTEEKDFDPYPTQSWVNYGTTKQTDMKTGKPPANLYLRQRDGIGLGFYSIEANQFHVVKVDFGVRLYDSEGKVQPYPKGQQEVLIDYTFTTQFIAGGRPHYHKKHKILIRFEFMAGSKKVWRLNEDNIPTFSDMLLNQHAYNVGKRLREGTRIVFEAGVTRLKNIKSRWNKLNTFIGTKEHPIIIEGEVGPNGELLSTLDGEGFVLTGVGDRARDLLGFRNSQYVIVRNLILKNASNNERNGGGIRLIKSGNITIENCIFENNNNGIFTAETRGPFTIKNNIFRKNGRFPGGHTMYLEGDRGYIINNYITDSQYHSFRSRLRYTYLAYNWLENAGNTEVSIFGGHEANQDNPHTVMIGNVIIKKPQQRSDGQPGNKEQFIQIGGRGENAANLYMYHNTFILDQDKALDDGADHKNKARVVMFSDSGTNKVSTVVAKNNVIYGSTGLGANTQAGVAGGLFENNLFMQNSIMPTNWTAKDNQAILDSDIPFINYTKNIGGHKNTPAGLHLNASGIRVVGQATKELIYKDHTGQDQRVSDQLFNVSDVFGEQFNDKLKQINLRGQNLTARSTTQVGAFEQDNSNTTQTCESNQDKVNNVCIDKCLTSETRDEAGICRIKEITPLTCPSGKEAVKEVCVDECPSHQVRNITGVCTNNIQCDEGEDFYNNRCVASCIRQHVRDEASGFCLLPQTVKSPDYHVILDADGKVLPKVEYEGGEAWLADMGEVDNFVDYAYYIKAFKQYPQSDDEFGGQVAIWTHARYETMTRLLPENVDPSYPWTLFNHRDSRYDLRFYQLEVNSNAEDNGGKLKFYMNPGHVALRKHTDSQGTRYPYKPYPLEEQKYVLSFVMTKDQVYDATFTLRDVKRHHIIFKFRFKPASSHVLKVDNSTLKDYFNYFYNVATYHHTKLLRAGSRILFKAGVTRLSSNFEWVGPANLLGTKENPIIIEGEVGENGELLSTIDAEGVDMYGGGRHARDIITLSASRHVIIRNLIFKNSSNKYRNGGGVRIIGGGNITIENCIFENNEMGVFTDKSVKGPVTIKNNTFINNGTFPGGHTMYLEGEQSYVINNKVIGSEYHSFKSRSRYTYLAYNWMENAGNTEISIQSSDHAKGDNAHIVMIGNVITKKPRQRSDGKPGNKEQFIEISQRKTGNAANVYLYNNTFILDQDKALDDNADHKNKAQLIQFFDNTEHGRYKVIAKNNIIFGSTGLSPNSRAGQSGGVFENNLYMSDSVIPEKWAASNNSQISSPPFKRYQINIDGEKNDLAGLQPNADGLALSPLPASSLTFLDADGNEHSLADGLLNTSESTEIKFNAALQQMDVLGKSLKARIPMNSIGALDSD